MRIVEKSVSFGAPLLQSNNGILVPPGGYDILCDITLATWALDPMELNVSAKVFAYTFQGTELLVAEVFFLDLNKHNAYYPWRTYRIDDCGPQEIKEHQEEITKLLKKVLVEL